MDDERPEDRSDNSEESDVSWPGEGKKDSQSDADDELGGSGWTPPVVEKEGSTETTGHGSGHSPQPRSHRPMIYGVARGVDLRREPNRVAGQDILIISFRVHEFGDEGNLVRQTPVELRGGSISGGIRDGDEVGLEGRWQDGVVRTKAVTIYKDGSVVGLVRATPTIAKWQIILAVLMVVAFIAFVIFGIRHVGGSGGPAGALGSQPTVPWNAFSVTSYGHPLVQNDD